ncbi:hypothetical protein AUEXF2481DRAFT_32034 [Aureobasidium subglaciale EXF-2481]|uniref:ASST-domain-containing protein n=1 Tax=Aureobasidium subglaciale (strain EXF-2481) TaxID=1043005 RepID=A0A074Y3Y3_AURSE|nr:uncharacterized protein AUEXF2481DRAFT_32034 [Aureobasidium subglaciale EXF-2481]KEQ92435.1 hypothetical protein AUEXF2481DRAFT_32034 [Aureobasidium subglaciale EXF-2481]
MHFGPVSLLFLLFALFALVFANDLGRDYNPLTVDANTWETQHGSYPSRSYHSSNLTSPAVRKAVDSPLCYDDNLIFLAPRGFRVPHPAVTILDNHGKLVWSQPVKGQAYNLKVQEYKGEKVLTYWVGDDAVGGHGEGYFYLLNNKYEEIARIRGVNNLRADLHELTITPEGTALVTFYQIFPLNQPGVFRIKDTVWIWDCLFQEFDIATQDLVFEWRASEHHGLNESYAPLGTDGYTPDHPYDWYHINSVQKDDLGNYLVSARFTSTITYISGNTGDILWILGGKQNSFADLSNGQATNFEYQHMARFTPITTFPTLMAKEIVDHGKSKDNNAMTKQLLTLFDNGIPPRPARGLILEVTYPSHGIVTNAPLTAKVIKSYEHPLHISSVSQGSLQLVTSNLTTDSEPHVLIGFGWQGVWTEYTADGTLLCDSRITPANVLGKGHVQSYSVMKFRWTGTPSHPPLAVSDMSRGSVFVSWNGATEVVSWQLRILVGQTWEVKATKQKAGFETELALPEGFDKQTMRYAVVEALGKDRNVLGKTETIDLWQSGLLSRISRMSPSGGGVVSVFGFLVAVAVLFFVASRVVGARMGGYQKLRRS